MKNIFTAAATSLIVSLFLFFPLSVFAEKPQFISTGNLNTPRYGHTATRLADGRILVTGGDNSLNTAPYLKSAEIYDPTTGKFSYTGDLITGRGAHSATLLADGKVLITGGYDQYLTDHTLNSAEIFNPSTGQFSVTGNLTVKRQWHSTTLLDDGRVLITGGFDSRVPIYGTYLQSAEIYDPNTGQFTATDDMTVPRIWFGTTKLRNGKVLVAGGSNGYAQSTKIAEIYDPSTGVFSSTGGFITSRWVTDGVLLPNNDVFFSGGTNCCSLGEVHLKSTEFYDAAKEVFSSSGNMIVARSGLTSTLLLSGKVLIAGGFNGSTKVDTAEIYDHASGNFSYTTSPMLSIRYGHTAALLADGSVLLAGGINSTNTALASAELYVGERNEMNWKMPLSGDVQFTQDYDCFNCIGNKRYHTGVDIISDDANRMVRAASSGSVEAIYLTTDAQNAWCGSDHNTPGNLVSVDVDRLSQLLKKNPSLKANHNFGNTIILRHQDPSDPSNPDAAVYTQYSHLKCIRQEIVDKYINSETTIKVEVSEALGFFGGSSSSTVYSNKTCIDNKTCWPEHLHFETKTNSALGNEVKIEFGYSSDRSVLSVVGYRDPMETIHYAAIETVYPNLVIQDSDVLNLYPGPGEFPFKCSGVKDQIGSQLSGTQTPLVVRKRAQIAGVSWLQVDRTVASGNGVVETVDSVCNSKTLPDSNEPEGWVKADDVVLFYGFVDIINESVSSKALKVYATKKLTKSNEIGTVWAGQAYSFNGAANAEKGDGCEGRWRNITLGKRIETGKNKKTTSTDEGWICQPSS